MLSRLKRWIQTTIGISGKEANGFIILVPIIFLTIFSEPLYRWYLRDETPIHVQETLYYDSLVETLKKPEVSETVADDFSLTEFDPNTASLSQFLSLGIPESVSKRIILYRSKGGSFRIKSDFSRIYGLDTALYQKLVPFIALPDQIQSAEPVKESRIAPVIQYDINLTDTTSLKTVKGIGTVLSKRILKYRESLGGFIDPKQFGEVYGLDSAVIQNLSAFYISTDFHTQKIKINSATEKELANHPYLSLRDARAIITYRMQHGDYSNLESLLKIKTLEQNTVVKIGPYLSFE